jgi:hypothetical protein
MLQEMSAEEFIDWRAFHRQFPFGYEWEDRNAARLVEVVETTKPREGKMPPFKDFLRPRPAPLKHERLKAEAKERRVPKNVRRRT